MKRIIVVVMITVSMLIGCAGSNVEETTTTNNNVTINNGDMIVEWAKCMQNDPEINMVIQQEPYSSALTTTRTYVLAYPEKFENKVTILSIGEATFSPEGDEIGIMVALINKTNSPIKNINAGIYLAKNDIPAGGTDSIKFTSDYIDELKPNSAYVLYISVPVNPDYNLTKSESISADDVNFSSEIISYDVVGE